MPSDLFAPRVEEAGGLDDQGVVGQGLPENETADLLSTHRKSLQLNTRQLGELFYISYNPDTAARQPLVRNPNDLTTTYIRKGNGESPYGGDF